ncbi:SAM-dependent methyltransferase [Dactylosporangium sp. CA-092794]|uniref:SAM-dependent methyltransferase n=1 Tax=Dactylosporangium sp. CA-092794 TaxID=3239929 RepID=UPI003D8C5931
MNDRSWTGGLEPGPAATASRMYDYYLGGAHNFGADRDAAKAVIAQLPDVPMVARLNRALLGRAVRYLAAAGVRQFLDIGSGLPTVGNVHEIAQTTVPDARVVYVDIDPVAVAEGAQLLEGNPRAVAVGGDLRQPQQLLADPGVRSMLDFTQPVGLLLIAVLHFVPDDAQAYDAVGQLVAALPRGSYVAISHGAAETFPAGSAATSAATEVYRNRTATPGKPRDQAGVRRFLDGLTVVAPGVVWAHQWHPDPTAEPAAELVEDPKRAGTWAAAARKDS